VPEYFEVELENVNKILIDDARGKNIKGAYREY